MLFSSKKGWLFIHVPKNAGTSLQANYSKMKYDHRDLPKDRKVENRRLAEVEYASPKGDVNHNKWSYFRKEDNFKNLKPLGILRNPWDRCLSIYAFSLQKAQEQLGQEWANYDHPLLIKQGFKNAWMPGGYFVDGHADDVNFNKETGRSWSYGDDQYSWLDGEGEWYRIEDQLGEFCKYTGLENPPRLNTSKRLDYRSYYDDELAEQISILFARDIKIGGYKFE